MEERKIALIPRVVVPGAMGPKDYALLLTSSRLIFVLENASKAGVASILGGAIGAAVVDAMKEKTHIDYGRTDPSALAADEKNTCVPYSSVKGLQLKKKWSGCHIRVDYTDASGKDRKIVGMLAMPEELEMRKRAEGVKPAAALEEYARMAKQAVELAIPPGVAQYAELEL